MFAVALALPVALAGCSSSGGAGASKTPSPTVSVTSSGDNGGGTSAVKGAITVYAAASLTEAFTTLKADFEKLYPGTSVTLNFDASSALATRITQGAAADVFASASPKNMTQIGDAAVMPQTFASNTAEVAVPPKNPGKITKLADLARTGVKVAVCAPAVPCGVLAAQVFQNARITVKATANPADVKSTLALVESGEVDAGVVYVTDVRAAGSKVKGIAIPAAVNARTSYPIARLKDSKNQPVAEAWVTFVLGAEGRKVLTADGFSSP